MEHIVDELMDRTRRTLSPAVIEAEDRYLGACFAFRDPALQAQALTALRPEDLQPSNGLILAAAQAVLNRGGGDVEQFSVHLELEARGELDQAGGPPRLADLGDESEVSSAGLLRYAVGKIREARQARDLWEVRDRLTDWLADGDMPLSEIQSRVARQVQTPRALDDDAATLADALERQLRRLEGQAAVPTLKIGLPTVDRLGGGLEAGEVGLICGMPGMGKSCLMAMQALYAARHWGPVVMVSLEMSSDRLALRQLAQGTTFSFHELRDNRTKAGARPLEAGWDELNGAHREVFEFAKRIYVEHHTFDLAEIVSRLRYLSARYGVKAAVIDYGQLIGAQVRKGGSQTEEQSVIARALKNEIATALNMPVWCLVQPNKDQTRRGDAALLKMSDIAGASEWRAVANQIWLINRDPKAKPAAPGQDEAQMPVLLEIAKSRDGGRATIPLTLLGERFLFVERDTHHGEPEARPLNGLRERRREWSGERDDSD